MVDRKTVWDRIAFLGEQLRASGETDEEIREHSVLHWSR